MLGMANWRLRGPVSAISALFVIELVDWISKLDISCLFPYGTVCGKLCGCHGQFCLER